jgi:cellulose biosynthesis protein BcsQ
VPGYSDILIDNEGRDTLARRSALATACVVVIPVAPCFMTQSAQDRLVSRIQLARISHADLRVLFVLIDVKCDPTFEYMVAVRALAARIPWATLTETVIHQAASFGRSFEQGLAVCECKPADGLAIGEMSSLYREIYKKYQRPSHVHVHSPYLHAA